MRRRRFGLPERLLAILLLVASIDFAANTFLFQRADRFEVRDEDASRIADTLVLARRAISRSPAAERQAVADALSTGRFSLRWSGLTRRSTGSVRLAKLRSQVVVDAPELLQADLELHLRTLSPIDNIGGSLLLPDHSVLTFTTYARSAWSLSAGRVAGLLLPTLLLLVFAWALFRAALRPLHALVVASTRVGAGESPPLAERGTDEVRQLIRAFNRMQARIHQSMVDRTRSMLAIGHDLRTPLARLQLRLDAAQAEPELHEGMMRDIAEMEQMLRSLQAFVESSGRDLPAQRIDLAAMATTLVDQATDSGQAVAYEGVDRLDVMARPVSLRRALANLIDNAVHYGGDGVVRVTVRGDRDAAEILVEDDGMGIPEDQLADVLQPFARLDTSRARDTPGMGLGLAIASQAAAVEGGTLTLANRAEGGLRATIRLPGAVVAEDDPARQH